MKFIKVTTTDEGKEFFINPKKIWYFYASEHGGTSIVLMSKLRDRITVKEDVETVTRLIEW